MSQHSDRTTTRDEKTINLMIFDAMLAICHTGVLLKFKGDLPKEYLKDRILSIMKANPILGGVVVMEGITKGHIKYPSEVEDADVDKVFEVSDDPTLKEIVPETPLKHVKGILATFMNRNDSISKTLRVIAWETTDKEGYHVYFTMSHAVGDGATLYTYLNMLSTDMEITTPNVERQLVFEEENLQNYYNHTTYPPMTSLTRMSFGIYRILWLKLGSRWCEERMECFKVSGDYIEKKKKEAQAAGGFVSTNDIITSWWLDKWPASHARFMVTNLRNRHEKITPDLAGNYVALMAFCKNEVVTPQVVRKALQTRAAHANTTPHVPSLYSWTFDYQSAVTNWSSFYKTILLPGGVQENHSPVFILKGTLPTNHMCIIYKSSDTQYNVAIELERTANKDAVIPTVSGEEILEDSIGH